MQKRKIMATLVALSMLTAGIGFTPSRSENVVTAATADTRIVVDLNANDGRKASYSKASKNWNVPGGTSAETTINGVTFKLSNGGSVGGDVRSVNCKILQLQSGIYPYRTMDGVTINDTTDGGVVKLEISGLSAGTHSLKTWHSCVDNVTVGTMKVTVNGQTTASGIKCPTRVTDENDAGIAYSEFTVNSGETVTVLISPEGSGNAWLNAFELDGGDPIKGISRISPEDKDSHYDKENGLSWTAGQGAKSHDVYIGTDFDSVYNATKASKEFKGNQTGTTYKLDDSYSSIPTYYWRVDTVNDSGTVKGAVYSFQVNRLAFPTAEGYGRFARGGRGGEVVHVTNLNDSGEGSLRWALCDDKWKTEDWKGVPRIIVFDVGGVIELQSALVVPDNGGNVYVAGQTAPGDGITLINYDFGGMGTSDLIIRDIRTRVGDMNGKSTGGMGLGSCNNSIVDHCSISWATDEGFSSRSAQNISFQWNIIGESLHESVHYNGDNRDETETHAFAASIGGYTGSFHHNLLIDCTGRNWSLAGAMEQDAKTYGGQLDIRNNVVYNWMDRTTDGGVRRLNFVNNLYKAGVVSNTDMHIVSMDGNELGTDDMQMMYVDGNVMLDYSGNYLLKSTDNAWDKGKAVSGGKNSTVDDVRSDTPFFESYVNTQSAEDAYKSVITGVGAGGTSETGWDYIDSRYIDEVTNNKYTYTGSKAGLKGIIDSQEDAGGYPNSTNFTFSNDGATNATNDTDRDGMPNTWEEEHGLNPNDASDGSMITLSADDYTNVEMYLNELAGDPVEFNAEPARELLDGTLVKSLDILDNENYADWSIQPTVKTGDIMFGDREVTVTSMPSYLENAEYIRTAADSKAMTADVATFTAGDDITAYIVLDKRVATIPEWLSDWTATDETIVNSNKVEFALYKKDFSKDEQVTLGTNGQTSGCVFYTVLVTEQGVEPETEPTVETTEQPTETTTVTETVTEMPTETSSETVTTTAETTAQPTTESTAGEVEVSLLGDVDCSEVIDIADLTMLAKHILNESIFPLPSDTSRANSDVNIDNQINSADIAKLSEYILEKITSFK